MYSVQSVLCEIVSHHCMRDKKWTDETNGQRINVQITKINHSKWKSIIRAYIQKGKTKRLCSPVLMLNVASSSYTSELDFLLNKTLSDAKR